MTDKELFKQAYDALDKITVMFEAVNGHCVMGGDDIYVFAIQAMMKLNERLKQEQPKTNQCAETCDRANLCAVCDNDIEHFYIYAKEFTLPITLKSLIGSHKNLRQKNKIKHDEWLRELSAARELGRKQGLEMVTEHEFVSVKKLKSMTINELFLFLYDGE